MIVKDGELILIIDEEGKEYAQIIDEIIYKLREQKLSYTKIAVILQKHDIKIKYTAVQKRCKEIYEKKGEIEPKLPRSKKSDKISYEEIYNLREEGLAHSKIVKKLSEDGKKASRTTIQRRCREIYTAKEKEEPKVVYINSITKKIADSEIYELRQQGLSYEKIAKKLKGQGKNISSATVQKRCKEINEKIQACDQKELVKTFLNLIKTRKATLEQIEKLAKYYGIKTEKLIDVLEEREK